MSEVEGVWRTIRGRRIFIKNGQSLTDAMKESGKFKNEKLTQFTEPTAEEFKKVFDEAKATQAPEDAWRVDDTHKVEDYKTDKLFITAGGSTIAIEKDGNIISVCKNMNSDDRGSLLLKHAVDNGGDRLDAFGNKLYNFYTKNGFEPVSWTRFNEEYAPHDWVKGRDKAEPVIFYKYTGEKTSTTYTDFLSSAKESEDYDVAKNIRDKEM